MQSSLDEPSTTTVDGTTAGSTPTTWRFRNWSVRTKLLAIVVLPLVAAIVATTLLTQSLVSTAGERALDEQLSEAHRSSLDLIRELQQEEAVVTADVLGIDGEMNGLPARSEQEESSTAATADLQARVADLVEEFPTLVSPSESADAALLRLESFRTSFAANSSATSVLPVASDYTAAGNGILTLSSAISELIASRDLRNQAAIAQTLADVNRLGVNEDVLLLGSADDAQREELASGLQSADDARQTALDQFRVSATTQTQQDFNRLNERIGRERRSRFANIVAATGLTSSPASEYLAFSLEAATDTSGLRDQLSADQVDEAQSLQQSAITRAYIIAILVLIVLIVGIVLTFFAIRGVIRPLNALRVGALDIAGNKLPRAIARIREGGGRDADLQVEPVDVDTVEETGQVARAFDELHREAIRLAAEQEQLRRNVNSILVNLSRRSQALVGRQLSLIDRLENQEKDPDQLSQLFRLDHLASRMRRNNDNLMVLAGAGGTQSGKPLPVVDVVRAAVSETEAYTRITVQAVPAVDVSASVANDLVHLLAELLDNATSFSPPTSRVTVAVRRTDDTGLVVEVTDTGVGIGPTELSEINRRLADTPEVNSDVPRQMGLFVVSRLARRHNVGVSLRNPDAGSGLVAAVSVPAAALVGDPSLPRRPELSASFGGRQDPSGDRSIEGVGSTAVGHELLGPHADPSPDTFAPNGALTNGSGSPTGNGASRANGFSRPNGFSDRPASTNGAGSNGVGPAEGGPQPRPRAGGDDRSGTSQDGPSRSELPDPDSVPATGPDPAPSPAPHPLDGTSGAPRPAPSTAAPEEMTPIFQELSAWFSGRDDVVTPAKSVRKGSTAAPVAPPAAPTPATEPVRAPAVRSVDAALDRAPELDGASELDGAPALDGPSELDGASVVPESTVPSFVSGADEGWQAVLAVERESVEEVTAVGLPRRRPKANLVPGSALPSRTSEMRSSGKHRDPDAVRGRLSSYQRGLQSGRNESRGGASPALRTGGGPPPRNGNGMGGNGMGGNGMGGNSPPGPPPHLPPPDALSPRTPPPHVSSRPPAETGGEGRNGDPGAGSPSSSNGGGALPRRQPRVPPKSDQ